MGLFDAGWVKALEPTYRPTQFQIEELERLRKDLRIPQDTFATLVKQSPATLRIVAEKIFKHWFNQMPKDTYGQVLAVTYLHMLLMSKGVKVTDLAKRNPSAIGVMAEGYEARLGFIGENLKNVDDLLFFMILTNEFSNFVKDDTFGATDSINRILGWQWNNRVLEILDIALIPYSREILLRVKQREDKSIIFKDIAHRSGVDEKFVEVFLNRLVNTIEQARAAGTDINL